MPARNFTALRSPVALLCFLLMAAGGVALDQWTKFFAFDTQRESYRLCDSVEHHGDKYDAIPAHDATGHVIPHEVIKGFLDLHVMANQGAVFGVGQGKRTLFIIVSVAAILFIFYLFAVSGRQWFYQLVLGMLLAGVVGNLYDRAVLEYVRDMIHMQITDKDRFPYIFNVADTLLCTGVGLMIVHSFFHNPKNEDAAKGAKAGTTAD